jgi:hypothetical protein
MLLGLPVLLGLVQTPTPACAQDGGVLFVPGFYGSGEYLLWRKRVATTPFSGTLTPIAGAGIDTDSYSLELEENTYDLESGYRVTLGWVTESGCDIQASYTYFHTDGARSLGSVAVDSDSIFAARIDAVLADNAALNEQFDENRVDFASESRGVDYDVLDVELGQYLSTFYYCMLRVFCGVRGANVDEHSFVVYTNGNGAGDDDLYLIDSSVRMDAVGFRCGTHAHWAVGDTGLRIVGKAALAMLYSDFRVSRVDVAFNESAGDVEIRRVAHDFNAVVPVAEVAMGVHWDIGPFSVGGGYELTNWFNMYQEVYYADHDDVNTSTGTPLFDRGDWTLDGWYFSASVLF